MKRALTLCLLVLAGCGGGGSSGNSASCTDGTPVGTETTWTGLYRDYFGPHGTASCSAAPGQCHAAAGDQGALPSGYVCGDSQASCFEGMTASGSIVPAGGTADATSTRLYGALRKAPPNAGGTMPRSPSCVAFSTDDLKRISSWISAGAKND